MDVDELVADVSVESPSGVDLEADPSVTAWMMAAESAANLPALEEPGTVLKPGAYPFWRQTADHASELLRRSQDLRFAAIYAQGMFYSEGLPGLASGLEVTCKMVQRHWDSLFPRLENGDASYRVNSVGRLGGATNPVILALRRLPLVMSSRGQAYTLSELERAQSGSNGEGAAPSPVLAEFQAALRDADTGVLNRTREQIGRALSAVQTLESSLDAAAPGESADLEPLRRTLEQMGRTIQPEGGTSDASAEANGGSDDQGASSQGARRGEGGRGGAIESRHDVARVLDQICAWYQANEPSSPVPILLTRAKRLVFKNFFEAVKDLAPSGLSDIERIAGSEDR